jgi:hypothetical protein
MGIVIAKSSFVHTEGGVRAEVHKGDQRSEHDPVVQANKRRFGNASEADVRKAVEASRPASDRR